jgi:hypothetical protein
LRRRSDGTTTTPGKKDGTMNAKRAKKISDRKKIGSQDERAAKGQLKNAMKEIKETAESGFSTTVFYASEIGPLCRRKLRDRGFTCNTILDRAQEVKVKVSWNHPRKSKSICRRILDWLQK